MTKIILFWSRIINYHSLKNGMKHKIWKSRSCILLSSKFDSYWISKRHKKSKLFVTHVWKSLTFSFPRSVDIYLSYFSFSNFSFWQTGTSCGLLSNVLFSSLVFVSLYVWMTREKSSYTSIRWYVNVVSRRSILDKRFFNHPICSLYRINLDFFLNEMITIEELYGRTRIDSSTSFRILTGNVSTSSQAEFLRPESIKKTAARQRRWKLFVDMRQREDNEVRVDARL